VWCVSSAVSKCGFQQSVFSPSTQRTIACRLDATPMVESGKERNSRTAPCRFRSVDGRQVVRIIVYVRAVPGCTCLRINPDGFLRRRSSSANCGVANRKGANVDCSVIPRGRFSLTNNTRPPPRITQHPNLAPSQWKQAGPIAKCVPPLALLLAFNRRSIQVLKRPSRLPMSWPSSFRTRRCVFRVPSMPNPQREPLDLPRAFAA
jgi:hypothetical protein